MHAKANFKISKIPMVNAIECTVWSGDSQQVKQETWGLANNDCHTLNIYHTQNIARYILNTVYCTLNSTHLTLHVAH